MDITGLRVSVVLREMVAGLPEGVWVDITVGSGIGFLEGVFDCEGLQVGLIFGLSVGAFVSRTEGSLVGEFAHKMLQELALHCASGLQQSASVVHP